MKFRILLTDEVLKDIDGIMDYIALDAPRRAETYADELLHQIHTLESMPKRCAVAPESGRRGYEMRHLIYQNYRILFTIKKSDIVILRVIHGARLLDPEG